MFVVVAAYPYREGSFMNLTKRMLLFGTEHPAMVTASPVIFVNLPSWVWLPKFP